MDTKSFSNKTKGDNSKTKKGRVVILVRDKSSGPVLHFYHVSSNYSKGYSSYRADMKLYANADSDADGIRPNMSLQSPFGRGGHNHYLQCPKDHNSKSMWTRVMVLVFCISSHGAEHFCKVHEIIWKKVFRLQSGHKYITKITIYNLQKLQK